MNSLYAYLAVFAGVTMEGEIALLSACIAAQNAHLEFWILFLVAFTGTLMVDWGVFFSTRFLGGHFMKRFPSLQRRMQKSPVRLERNPRLMSFLYRFMYGFRIVTLVMLGVSSITTRKFMMYSVMAILVWVSAFSLLGYYLGQVIHRYFVFLDHMIWYVIIVVSILGLIVFLIRRLSKKLLD